MIDRAPLTQVKLFKMTTKQTYCFRNTTILNSPRDYANEVEDRGSNSVYFELALVLGLLAPISATLEVCEVSVR